MSSICRICPVISTAAALHCAAPPLTRGHAAGRGHNSIPLFGQITIYTCITLGVQYPDSAAPVLHQVRYSSILLNLASVRVVGPLHDDVLNLNLDRLVRPRYQYCVVDGYNVYSVLRGTVSTAWCPGTRFIWMVISSFIILN
eukprot:SAG31_NODE_5255_length_2647_cov_1.946625_1_plen_142_part_00